MDVGYNCDGQDLSENKEMICDTTGGIWEASQIEFGMKWVIVKLKFGKYATSYEVSAYYLIWSRY